MDEIEGVFEGVEMKEQFELQRRQFWIDIFLEYNNVSTEQALDLADGALNEFDNRFPPEEKAVNEGRVKISKTYREDLIKPDKERKLNNL